jgi:hypothetical protein
MVLPIITAIRITVIPIMVVDGTAIVMAADGTDMAMVMDIAGTMKDIAAHIVRQADIQKTALLATVVKESNKARLLNTENLQLLL